MPARALKRILTDYTGNRRFMGQKTKNAREGIETESHRLRHSPCNFCQKTKNAREGIETMTKQIINYFRNRPENKKCPRGH